MGWTLRAGLPSGGGVGRQPPSGGSGSRKWKTRTGSPESWSQMRGETDLGRWSDSCGERRPARCPRFGGEALPKVVSRGRQHHIGSCPGEEPVRRKCLTAARTEPNVPETMQGRCRTVGQDGHGRQCRRKNKSGRSNAREGGGCQ